MIRFSEFTFELSKEKEKESYEGGEDVENIIFLIRGNRNGEPFAAEM